MIFNRDDPAKFQLTEDYQSREVDLRKSGAQTRI
jgi:hypothetical protein